MLEHGDSQSISDHVLNSARATAPGVRLLVKQWAEREDDSERMSSSKQIHREFNSPADKLANLDVIGFIEEMSHVVPDGTFVKLEVPAHAADLSPLVA